MPSSNATGNVMAIPDVSIVEVSTPSTSVEEVANDGYVTTIENISSISVDNEHVNLIEVGMQGPPGPGGYTTPYEARSDTFSDALVYRGESAVGSLETAYVWRVRRIAITYGSTIATKTEYANGSQSFTTAWSNRYTQPYS